MDGCLFLIGYGLWWLIKGVFKVIWLIVSCPFRIAEKCRNQKMMEQSLEEKRRLRKKASNQAKETVENLFLKIKKDLLEIQLKRQDPAKIVIYDSYVELFYEDGEYRKIQFSAEHGITLKKYSYFYYLCEICVLI